MPIFNSMIANPKEKIFESQENGEHVYFLLRRHPITNLGWLIVSVLMAIFPIIAVYFLDTTFPTLERFVSMKSQTILIILWYTLTLFFTFESFLKWYFNVYILTDKRVIDVDFSGFWHKRISEASLDNVEDASYETNKFLHIVFDYGDIFMQTAAERREFEFHAIPKPSIVHDKLTDLVQLYKQKVQNAN